MSPIISLNQNINQHRNSFCGKMRLLSMFSSSMKISSDDASSICNDDKNIKALNNNCAIADRLRSMMKQEQQYSYRCDDYLQNSTTRASKTYKQTPVDEECRRKMVLWCYKVIDVCKFSRETISVAMSYLDRYLCTKEGQLDALPNRRNYQLSAATTLYMATKLCEPFVLDSALLARLSRGTYTKEDILQKEREILDALQWKLLKPTPSEFARHFLVLLHKMIKHTELVDAIEDYAIYQTEIAVVDYELALVAPSCIAVASLLNAIDHMDEIDETRSLIRSKVSFINYIKESFPGCLLNDYEFVQEKLSSMLLKDCSFEPNSSRRMLPSTNQSRRSDLVHSRKEQGTKRGSYYHEEEEESSSPVSCITTQFRRNR